MHPSNHRRLFLGIPLSEEVRKHIKKRFHMLEGKMVPPRNWHVSLHFLGNVVEEKIPELHQALNETSLGEVFPIIFNHLGSFPLPKHAKVLWIGISMGTEKLQSLAKILGETLVKVGFALDPRQFVPHLTICRFAFPKNMEKFIEKTPFPEISMPVERVILYESIQGSGPPQYVELYSYPLRSYTSTIH